MHIYFWIFAPPLCAGRIVDLYSINLAVYCSMFPLEFEWLTEFFSCYVATLLAVRHTDGKYPHSQEHEATITSLRLNWEIDIISPVFNEWCVIVFSAHANGTLSDGRHFEPVQGLVAREILKCIHQYITSLHFFILSPSLLSILVSLFLMDLIRSIFSSGHKITSHLSYLSDSTNINNSEWMEQTIKRNQYHRTPSSYDTDGICTADIPLQQLYQIFVYLRIESRVGAYMVRVQFSSRYLLPNITARTILLTINCCYCCSCCCYFWPELPSAGAHPWPPWRAYPIDSAVTSNGGVSRATNFFYKSIKSLLNFIRTISCFVIVNTSLPSRILLILWQIFAKS